MAPEWEERPLEDCMDAIIDYRGKTPKKTSSGIPLITAKIIKNGAIQPVTEFIAEDDYDSWMRRGLPHPGDIVMTTEAPLGEVAQLDGKKVALAQRVITLRGKRNVLDNRFLKYLITSQYVQHQLDGRGTGTTVKGIKQSELRRLTLRFPSFTEQKSIAHILGTLDDKIELNRQMNTTLEAMTQALFKSWFVDFDPVIDNTLAAGNLIPEALQARAATRQGLGKQKKPMAENIRQQFPSSFVFSEELGWMPKGWKVKALGDYLDVFETGRRPKGGVAKYTSGIPSVGAESIKGIGIFDFGKTKFIPEEFFENMKSGKINNYDVLLYKDGGKPGDFKPRIGMFGNGFPFDSYGINEHVFRMRSEKLGQPFLYFQAGSVRVFHHFAVRGGKAAIPGINRTDVKSVDFLIPSVEVLNRFNKFSYSHINKILGNAIESQSLTKLRDTLLPKLLSGELRIPDAEKLVANAL